MRTERAAPGPLAIVGVSLAALAVGTFVATGLGALAPELRDAFGFSRAEIGILTGLFALGASAMSLRAGRLTDSVGPVRVLAVSLVSISVATGLGALAPAGALLMLAMFVAGLGYGGVNPPTNVVIAGQLSDRLGLFISLKQTGVPIGGFLAGIVLPAVAVSAGWRAAVAVGAIGPLVVAAATVLLRGARVLGGELRVAAQGLAGADGTVAPRPTPAVPATTRRDRVVMLVFGFLMSGCQGAVLAYLVLSLTDGEGWSLRQAGLTLSTATAVSVAGRLAWGWYSDRAGRRVGVLVFTAAAGAIGLAALAAGPPHALVWPVAALIGAALVSWNGVFHALVVERSGPGALGRSSGQALLFMFGGSMAVPPLLGLLSQLTDSWTTLWAADAGLVAAAGLLLRFGLTGARPAPPAAPPSVIATGFPPGTPVQ